jgi:hypothetical protein
MKNAFQTAEVEHFLCADFLILFAVGFGNSIFMWLLAGFANSLMTA